MTHTTRKQVNLTDTTRRADAPQRVSPCGSCVGLFCKEIGQWQAK